MRAYNSINFGRNKLKLVSVKCLSKTGDTLQIRLDNVIGPIIALVEIFQGSEWKTVKSPLLKYQLGIHNLVVQSENNNVEIDWVSFK